MLLEDLDYENQEEAVDRLKQIAEKMGDGELIPGLLAEDMQ